MAAAKASSQQQVILALDIGSSSVRCTAYRTCFNHQHPDGEENNSRPILIDAIEGCMSSRTVRSIQPNTGKIVGLGKNNKDDDDNMSLLDVIDLCIDDTLGCLRRHYSANSSFCFCVVGLGLSTFVMNLVGVNDRGELVGSHASISYACNTPLVAEECRQLRQELGSDPLQQLYQRTGAPLHSAYALPQLRAFYSSTTTGDADKVFKWQTIASLCLSRWTGRTHCPISYSEASWTGLLHFRTCRWDNEALQLLPEKCQDALPDLADCTDPLEGGIPEFVLKRNKTGTTSDDSSSSTSVVNPYWTRWPELRGCSADQNYNNINSDDESTTTSYCRLFLGIGDGACANIGSKCSTPSRIAVTIGTSAAARVCLPLAQRTRFAADEHDENITVPPGLFCYRVDRSHVLLGGALTDGGSVVEWARSLLNLTTDDKAFQECITTVQGMLEADYEKAGQQQLQPLSPLTMIPFLSGERSTGFRDGANGAVLGLTRDTTPAKFLKACLEGVIIRLQAILRLLHGNNIMKDDGTSLTDSTKKPRIVASGNALERNALWRQMLADCSGMMVELDHDSHEGTSRGVARIVAAALAMQTYINDDNNSQSSGRYLGEEAIVASTVSEPRVSSATTAYWKNAMEAQEQLIGAVGPLWH